MSGMCAGRVAVVTGAARGLGRAHAVELARQGARVVVNDVGVRGDGGGADPSACAEVAAEIRGMGGEVLVDGSDVADWEQARALIDDAVTAFGGLDVLVNNAGFLRDRMFVNMSEQDWDEVVRVHLKGHAAMLRHAAELWRTRAKSGHTNDARVINTTSGAGLLGSVGQTNYAAAKAGIIALTLNAAAELGRYGVNVNALAPSARTRMTEGAFGAAMSEPGDGSFDEMAPENVAPVVAWLGSDRSAAVTGRVFEVAGGCLSVAQGWSRGPEIDVGRRLRAAEVDEIVPDLLARAAAPGPVYGAAS
ncbi:SDR family oxidoreductase [Salinifilum ghardaiensis]